MTAQAGRSDIRSATDTATTVHRVSAREVRVLEGPNLYFRRPAVKLVLDVSAVVAMPTDELARRTAALGWRARPGQPATQARQR